jgi:hypothetical protein
MLRANSRLRQSLGEPREEFLGHAAGAIQRILPHVKVSQWNESSWAESSAKWGSSERTEIRVTVAAGTQEQPQSRALSAAVTRRRLPGIGGAAGKTLDEREFEICKLIATQISEVLAHDPLGVGGGFVGAVRDAFDESMVAKYLETSYESTQMLFYALHRLSEQSYENKALTFGCILESGNNVPEKGAKFPGDFLISKKYKALSDGYRTAYRISAKGKILGFVELDLFSKKAPTKKHYYPDWAEPIAQASRPDR